MAAAAAFFAATAFQVLGGGHAAQLQRLVDRLLDGVLQFVHLLLGIHESPGDGVLEQPVALLLELGDLRAFEREGALLLLLQGLAAVHDGLVLGARNLVVHERLDALLGGLKFGLGHDGFAQFPGLPGQDRFFSQSCHNVVFSFPPPRHFCEQASQNTPQLGGKSNLNSASAALMCPARNMNKRALIKKIIAALTDELEIYFKAALASRAEATHEQSRAESKYDTRGLEASYLAHGQSRQAAEIEAAIAAFEKLPLRNFKPGEPADLGAFVELQHAGERMFYFIGPKAGGTEIVHDKKEVLVITPQSPLGGQLCGRRSGELVSLQLPGDRRQYHIVAVA